MDALPHAVSPAKTWWFWIRRLWHTLIGVEAIKEIPVDENGS
jgi:hypothetical protein